MPLHHENPAFQFMPEAVPEGERWHFYDGVPEVTARSNGAYHHEPCWYRNFLYDEELARGLDAAGRPRRAGPLRIRSRRRARRPDFFRRRFGTPAAHRSLAG